MTFALALALAFAAAAVCVTWWGAGIILHPPKMSRLEVFPEQFGLRYEKVSFKTKDGLTLRGWFLPSPRPGEDRTLLMCHGWGDNKGELLKLTYFLNQDGGFNLLYFDNRSHGESDGNVTTIGYLETIDFEAAIRYLREHRPRHLGRLGVFGLSMGAAVAAMAVPDYPEVRAVALESPFTNYQQVVRQWTWNNLRIPYFPLVFGTLLMLRLRVGELKVDAYSPIRFIASLAPRPLLIISGSEDRLMPEDDVRRLFAAAREPKTLWIIPGAAHAKCRELAGLEYETRVISFFERHL